MRLLDRVRQFWQALVAFPAAQDLNRASQFLSPQLLALFLRQQASEQVHSLRVFLRLYEMGEQSPDLLSAALLHDVGKSFYPLRIWERVFVVIGQALAFRQAMSWGQAAPCGWKRPFVVAKYHAHWGAEMVEAAGGSPLTVKLILRHHDALTSAPELPEDHLLQRLQSLDHKS